MAKPSAAQQKREQLKAELFPREVRPWLGPEETGYFCAPRSLPLVLALLNSKQVSGDKDPTTVYVDLLSRHLGQGIVEMGYEDDHAFASGYYGSRSTRTWRDRMRILEDVGLIRVAPKGNRQYGYVLLVHPTIVIQSLMEQGHVSEEWWNAFRVRQIETKEPLADDLQTLE